MAFTQFQFRRDSAADWTAANPVLAEGEIGLELDTSQFKIGDGTSQWSALPYGGIQGPQGIQGIQGIQGSTQVTVTDSAEIDFTLTGQDITASLKAGSIDETKLDASVNASLINANTFPEAIIINLSPLNVDLAQQNKAAIIPYLPYNLEVQELVLEVDTAPTGSNIEVDINVDGSSFLTTVISIEATETSSTTAATAYAIDTTAFPNSRIAKGSTVTVDIDQIGSTVPGQNLVLIINGERY
jgi:hypothetical protein